MVVRRKVVRKTPRVQKRYQRRSYKSRSYVVSRTIAQINNVQPNQAVVQGILAVHNPGAATGWAQVAYEVLSGAALLQMLSNAFTVANVQLSGVSVSCKSEASLNLLVAYKETANTPYRVISGVGFVNAYFKFPQGAVNMMLPDHIIIIAEGAATFRFKYYLARSTIRSVI